MPAERGTIAARKKRLLEIATHIVVWLILFCLPYNMRFGFINPMNSELRGRQGNLPTPGVLSMTKDSGSNQVTFFYQDTPLVAKDSIAGQGRTRYPETPYMGQHLVDRPGNFFYLDLLTKGLWVSVFYLNAFLLAPLFIYRKKYVTYALLIVAMLFLIALLHNLARNRFDIIHPAFRVQDMGRILHTQVQYPLFKPMPFGFLGSIIVNLAPYFLTIFASILYRMLRDKARSEMLYQQKQEENMKTELSFLRSQISPHFIFNILNNITALARLKSDDLEPTVIKLSSLMRYMLYEANEEKVLLKTETEYLTSYIDLQRQRFGSKVIIHVDLGDGDMDNVRIEPMLLIPFVENAFKHGVGLITRPQINIHLSVRSHMLVFTVSNKCAENDEEIKDTASGIGFTNVHRRLNLLYGKAHELRIHKELDDEHNIWFHVSLSLKLHHD